MVSKFWDRISSSQMIYIYKNNYEQSVFHTPVFPNVKMGYLMGSLDNHTGPIFHSRYSPTHINQQITYMYGNNLLCGDQSVRKGRPRHNGDTCTILKTINNHFILGHNVTKRVFLLGGPGVLQLSHCRSCSMAILSSIPLCVTRKQFDKNFEV